MTSRRTVLAGMAAVPTTLLAAQATQAAGAGFGPGPISGMPWHSGCQLNRIPEFERYRGRKADVYTCWQPRDSWGDVAGLGGGFAAARKAGAGRVSTGLCPLPRSASILDNRGNYRLAAGGAFDSYYTAYSRALAASGERNVIVRIGWESNHSYPWFSGVDPGGFAATFARIARILRAHNPTVSTEWSNVRQGRQKGSVLAAYPGDEVVDIIGVNYYDRYPAFNSTAIWNGFHHSDYHGGPQGLGAWLGFAKSRGKKISISEWGVARGMGPGSTDNPLYIELMHDFFASNRNYLAYEDYFNQIAAHQITPANLNPRASAMYKKLWA